MPGMAPKRTPKMTEAESRLARLEEEMREVAARRDLRDGERSDAHHHPAEAATDAEERERALRSQLEAQRRQETARRAKQALSDGTYGVCVECGAEIPAARLRIRPDAERCVPCQTVADRRR
jgi:DnaK suppressor protein